MSARSIWQVVTVLVTMMGLLSVWLVPETPSFTAAGHLAACAGVIMVGTTSFLLALVD